MGLVAQMRPAFGHHHGGIRIGRAHMPIGHPLIPMGGDGAILRPQLLDPVMALIIRLGEILTHRL